MSEIIKQEVDNYVQQTIRHQLQKCIQKWGLEGTEQKICELYSLPSTRVIRDRFLNTFRTDYLGFS